jgi:hypothetical protein
MFSLQQNQRREQNKFCLEAEGWGQWELRDEVAQTMCTRESKCTSNKIKGEKIKVIEAYYM